MKSGISYAIAGLLCLFIAFGPSTLGQNSAPSPQQSVTPIVVPVSAPDFDARVNFVVKCCLAVLGGIATVVGAVVALWMSLKPQLITLGASIAEIRSRLDRQAAKTGSLQEQVTANARAIPAAAPAFVDGSTASSTAKGTLAAILVTALAFSGCATDTGNQKKDRQGRVTNAVLKDVFAIVVQGAVSAGVAALQGQNGQDAAEAAFLSAAAQNGPNIVGDAITAYAGPQAKPIAAAAEAAVALANPQTPADKAKVLNTIGAAIQQVANQAH